MVENTQPAPQNNASILTGGAANSFNKLAIHGAFWTVLGFGVKQAPRFVNRLILARLLFPELFGIMAIVDTLILGLIFFSDIGINPSIIQNKRGSDREFLNTAWTIQVARGFLLWLIALLVAAPVASYYGHPILRLAIPVAGLTSILAGFKSTKFALANRQLLMREITFIEVTAYVAGITVMIVWAYLRPSIWALIAGNLVTAFLDALFSHFLLKGEGNRLVWNRQAAKEIFQFGRWIFISTALTFLASQSDRLLIGGLTTMAFLGIFSNALMFSRIVEQGIMQMGYRILFPSYAELVRRQPTKLYRTVRQSRLILIVVSALVGLFFILFGEAFIQLLFNDEWEAAGWMLRILGFGSIVSAIGLSYDSVLLALGKTFQVAMIMAFQFVILIAALYIGFKYGGEQGLVIGLACLPWLTYPFRALWVARYKLWQPEIDLPAFALASILAVVLAF